MKTEIKEEKGSKIKIFFEVDDKDLFKKFEDRAIAEFGEKVNLNGFRPGKIPRDVLKKHIDERLIHERTLEILAESKLKDLVLEKDISVVDTKFSLKKYVPGQIAEFEIEVTTFPVISLPDYKKISKEYGEKDKKKILVSKEDIDKSIDYLRKSRAKYKASEAGAQRGNFVEIDFEITSEGEKIEDNESKNYPFVMGEDKLISGFEKEIEGLRAGDTKEFSLKAPADYWRKDLNGKKLDFKVKINAVLERELPEINDEFAKSLGGFDNMESVEKSIKDGLMTEKEREEKERFKGALIAKLTEEIKTELPQIMIEREVEKIIHDFEHGLHSKGIKKEKYLAQIGKDENALKKDLKPQAEKNIKTYLVLRDVARAEKIEVSEEKIKEEVKNYLKKYKNPEDAAKEIDPETLYHYTKDILTNQEAINKLLGYANY